MPTSLLYVSKAVLRLRHAELDAIMAVARPRNAALNVTGALVFTGCHFAQVLEGSVAALSELMGSIRRDPRHSRIHVVQVEDLAHRRFADWSIAYAGPSRYVDKHIAPLVDPHLATGTRAAMAEAIIHLMERFAAEGGVESA